MASFDFLTDCQLDNGHNDKSIEPQLKRRAVEAYSRGNGVTTKT